MSVGETCNDEAFILLEPVFTVALCGESFTYNATVMVYDPALDTYLPSDCHGTDFVFGFYQPYLYYGYASIDCETGFVTGEYCDILSAQKVPYVYLQNKPWIFGSGMLNLYSTSIYNTGEDVCRNYPGECVDEWEFPSCYYTHSCSLRGDASEYGWECTP